MARFEHDGVEIAHEQRGAGPAFLFLHNGGASSTIWRHQVTALSASYRTVAVDLPGFVSWRDVLARIWHAAPRRPERRGGDLRSGIGPDQPGGRESG
jgi:pimeloyl-ACP methyl ester carboxylesterase